jgi:ribosomal protein L34
MKMYVRNSSLKHRRMTGFRRRMRSHAGRRIINRQRATACGTVKWNRR